MNQLALACLVVVPILAGCGMRGEDDSNGSSLPLLSVLPAGVDVPDDMVFVPGGETHVGSTDGPAAERPVFTARVRGFFMDVHPVTVAEFREFVEATGYVTDAERFGNGAMLRPGTGEWELVAGATWHHPRGPGSPGARDDHPVTQVSWFDASAYAAFAGKRLPAEVEWEHAARGGNDSRNRYAWGGDDQGIDDVARHANVWQGSFPERNTGEDGYMFTSPVGAFGTTALGLADLGGNVWEWTADWYRAYADRALPFSPTPTSERSMRGGSFLCHESYCHGYRVSARSHATPESSFFHVGFRLVRDLPATGRVDGGGS
ncbi:MAG TPA: formylglycine-generating enzyme family protein [Gemmatimonadaceae bacterium]|nr:formylglycine-generating enzyme family protein [Gemmatimonadaceae bacterium]